MPVWGFSREGTINLRDLQSEFDHLVDRLWHGGFSTPPLDGQDWAPPIELVDETDRFVIATEVPGMTSEDISVSVVGRVLTVSGVKPAPRRQGDESRLIRNERRFGRFKRVIDLPEAVDDTRVHATYAAGVLTISLPKQSVAHGRKVPVESGD